uniref:Uncharacterized protein n=1 Tax=Arundo donax TaxID=35708 RepID=A0A0A9CJG7_ARUDO
MRLIKYKNEYWKQRYTIRWVKFGGNKDTP